LAPETPSKAEIEPIADTNQAVALAADPIELPQSLLEKAALEALAGETIETASPPAVEAAPQQIAELQARISSLQTQLRAAAKSGADLLTLRGEVHRLRVERDTLQDTLDETKARLQTERSQRDSIDQRVQELDSLTKTAHTEQQRLQALLDDASRCINELNADRDALRRSLDEATTRADSESKARSEVENVGRRELEQSRAETASARETIRGLQAQLEAAGETSRALEAARDKAAKEILGARAELEKAVKENGILAAARDADARKSLAATAELEKALTELRERNDELDSLRQELQRSGESLTSTSERLAREQRSREAAEREFRESITAARDEFDHERLVLQRELEEDRRRAEEARRLEASAQEHTRRLQQNYDEIIDKLASVEAQSRTTQDSLGSEIERLTAAIESANKAQAEAEQRADALAAEVRSRELDHATQPDQTADELLYAAKIHIDELNNKLHTTTQKYQSLKDTVRSLGIHVG
jgi:chromosome segregation ATPase